MARPIWNGVISFGLLNIPVTLQAAERRVDVHFRMVDSRNNKPIRYERVNAESGEEVPWNNIVQAFEYEKGNYVVLSKDDIASVAPEGKESIEIEAFVGSDSISPVYFEKPYYLLPGKKAEKGYVLLREVLRQYGRVGIGHVVIRTRRYLCALLPIEDRLVLDLLRYRQEIVDPGQFEFPEKDLKKFRISAAELDMAEKLVDSMTISWKPEKYIDDHRKRLHDLVEKRLKLKNNIIHEQKKMAGPDDSATNVVDFMALLKKSLKNDVRPRKQSSEGSGAVATARRSKSKSSRAKETIARPSQKRK